MYSKINLGELMDRQPGEGSGAGEEPVPDPGLPGGQTRGRHPTRPGSGVERSAASGVGGAPDPGLAGFVEGGVWDSAAPSAALAVGA